MVFITTFTEEIYNICGKKLLESFIETENYKDHRMFIFFENQQDLFTEFYPDWLIDWHNKEYFTFINLMNYEYGGYKIVDHIDNLLKNKINFTDEYSSPRSVKWFRPVAAIHYFYELTKNINFCSIDADVIFTKKIPDNFFERTLNEYNITFLGRENFKIIRHGNYASDGNYIHTKTVNATKKDTHTETGYIGFNMNMPGTETFIVKNFEYWINQDVLKLEFKTDCHTFDAVRKDLNLKYNNLCDVMGEISPIGSRVIENSLLGEFLIHNKGTIGPILYDKNKL